MKPSLVKCLQKSLDKIGISVRRHKICRRPDNVMDIRAAHTVRPRVLLATQPKAGTYLLSAILAEMHLHQTYLHIGSTHLQAYDPNLQELNRTHPMIFDVEIPLRESLFLIRTGEFAASHLPPTEELRDHNRDIKVIAAKRDLRRSLVSSARFSLETGRIDKTLAEAIQGRGLIAYLEVEGEKHIQKSLEILKWEHEENAIMIKMEDLKKAPEKHVRRIIDFLGLDGLDAERVWKDALEKPSLTKSGDSHSLEWGAVEEEFFKSIGGREANREMGYEPT